MSTDDTFDLAAIQGNILRGYRAACVRHLVMEIRDAAAARRWIGEAAAGGTDGIPAITSGATWDERPDRCVNLGVTAAGLRALGVGHDDLESFPLPFRQGMAYRHVRLGDTGPSDPSEWDEHWRDPDRVHLVVSVHADTAEHVEIGSRMITSGPGARAFRCLGTHDGANFDGDNVHFGYRDNISQPRFEAVHDPSAHSEDPQPFSPLGAVLLGHETALEGLRWRVPSPDALGRHGTFNAFRILRQDSVAFERYLDDAADVLFSGGHAASLVSDRAREFYGDDRAALREVVAAKMCGRWRTGTPLELSPDDPAPDPPVSDVGFDYLEDERGLRCPVGSHTRRCNPRGAKIVQRVGNHTRRIVRRGIPYGPAHEPGRNDDAERGLLGVFLCSSLDAQFEPVQYDWLNLGLQHPDATGTNDPLLGANDADTASFHFPTADGVVTLRGLPRFVTTRGGAYTFLPSMAGLRHLGAMHPD